MVFIILSTVNASGLIVVLVLEQFIQLIGISETVAELKRGTGRPLSER